MAIAQIDDAEMYYEIHGSGHPLILIGGYTCDHTTWDTLSNELKNHFQVILIDNRGAGQTTDKGKSLSAELLASDIALLAKQLNLQQPHIVGHSMGGTIAQVFASQYPSEIGNLCIVTSSAKWRNAMLMSCQLRLDMRENNESFDRQFNDGISWLFGDAFLTNKDKLLSFKNTLLTNPHPQSLDNQKRQFDILKSFNGASYLTSIKAPTLIAYGSQDIISLPTEAEHLATTIKNASLVEFDCGHCIPLEMPEKLTDTLISFFK